MKVKGVLFAVVLLEAIFLSAAPSWAAVQIATFTVGNPAFTVDGRQSLMDTMPYVKDNRVYLPLRYAALAVGVEEPNIIWDGARKIVTLVKSDRVVQMTVGSGTMQVNGLALAMDAAPEIFGGRVMVPLRAAAQALGAQVEWDSVNRQVVIYCSGDRFSSKPGSAGVVVQRPEAPTGLLVESVIPDGVAGHYRITLTWNPVSGATAYRIYSWASWLPNSDFTFIEVKTNRCSSTYAGKSPGNWEFYVTAVNSAGESPPGTGITVNVPSAAEATSPGRLNLRPDIIRLPDLSYPSSVRTIKNTYTWLYQGKEFTWTVEVPLSILEQESFYQIPCLVRRQESIINALINIFGAGITIEKIPSILVNDEISSQYMSYVSNTLHQEAAAQGYDLLQEAEFVASFVQAIPYRLVNENTEYPPQVIANGGDCWNKSTLLAAILHELNYPVCVLLFNNGQVSHAAVGIGFPNNSVAIPNGTCYYHGGVAYYFCESTVPGWKIGQISGEWGNPRVCPIL